MTSDPNRDLRRFAPATLRNRQPLLEVLSRVLPPDGTILEVASGTGEHAVFFAGHLSSLAWLPSDPDPDNRRSIAAWVATTGVQTVCDPLDLDASTPVWPIAHADAVVCINMIHIAPWAAAEGLFAGAARILASGAPLVLYGPFRRHGAHTADSNAAFDEGLRAQDPAWGVRDLEGEVLPLAARTGFTLDAVVEMPANNLTIVFRRG